MNKVEISSSSKPPPEWKGAGWKPNVKKFILKILKRLNQHNAEISVLFCADEFIKSLNVQYRNKDEPTDILSFPRGEDSAGCSGDIAISLDTLLSNARIFGLDPDEELKRLLIHGILHLSGFDHKKCLTAESTAAEPMFKLQEDLMAEFKDENIINKMKKDSAKEQ